mmetsp:Transcript_9263/g.14230  ORF Transcript_9263/g.14230 Transcript_9263/m.14230 type:complete len:501 (-) Transcript_9263:952-2454(-)
MLANRLWKSISSDPAMMTLLYYTQLYGVQILLLTALSAMTIYRRELSCNHGYHVDDEDEDDDDDDNNDIGNRDLDSKTKDNTTTSPPSSPLQRPKTAAFTWDDETAELLLEGAGNYCSGQPLFLALGALWFNIFITTSKDDAGQSSKTLTTATTTTEEEEEGPLATGTNPESTTGVRDGQQLSLDSSTPETRSTTTIHKQTQAPFLSLPPDCQVQILSYLHPRDVVTFACTSKVSSDIVDKGDTAMVLWKQLWYRDYAWIVTQWDVGKRALQRSVLQLQVRHGRQHIPTKDQEHISLEFLKAFPFHKQFYFRFGQSYLNYVLAGQNKADQCLVGLHGHIYDITPFLDAHPGSPDTLLIHSGRDTTKFFEDMGHSTGARKMSKNMCLVVDAFCLPPSTTHSSCCGLYPTTTTTTIAVKKRRTTPIPVPMERTSTPLRPCTLAKFQIQYDLLTQRYQQQMETQLSTNSNNVLGPVNVYYDPFVQEWQTWYTDTNLETVFVLP